MLLMSASVFTSQVSYYYAVCCRSIWLILLQCRIMNEGPTFCSKFERQEGDNRWSGEGDTVEYHPMFSFINIG